jgi:hypothetical protein
MRRLKILIAPLIGTITTIRDTTDAVISTRSGTDLVDRLPHSDGIADIEAGMFMRFPSASLSIDNPPGFFGLIDRSVTRGIEPLCRCVTRRQSLPKPQQRSYKSA